MDGIKRIPLRDANEHTLITEVIYPMINALESKLDANLLAVEDFWEKMYAKEGQSVKQQNEVLLKRYLQSLKVRIHSLTGNDMDGDYAFDDYLKAVKKDYLECKDFPDHAHRNFVFGEGGIGREMNTDSPVYFISPFTVVKPQLKGNYNQPADFLNATEVLTVSRPAPNTSHYFQIPPLYWKRIDWNSLYPDSNIKVDFPEIGEDYFNQLMIYDEIKSVNVYKLVQFFDDPNNPICPRFTLFGETHQGKPVIREMLFKLSFAAIPTKEGYRLAPASFTAISIGEGNGGLPLFPRNRQIVLEVINNYPAQGLFNWNNL